MPADDEAFREALGQSARDRAVAVFDELVGWARAGGLVLQRARRETSTKGPELYFRSSEEGPAVFSVLGNGDLLVQVRWLKNHSALKNRLDELAENLANVPGVCWKRDPKKLGFPNVALAALDPSTSLRNLLIVFDWIIDQLARGA
ncbi:MAG: hypothetical protein ABR600_05630 [Actinomycetota bacterium]